jgi:short-subunit dehydrogenase
LITGASSGIGAATAVLFGGRGYRVVLAARRTERLLSQAETVRQAGGQPLVITTDITQLDQVENLVHKTIEKFGRIDILVNNAGLGRMNWLDRMDPLSDIQYQMQVNLISVIQTCRVVLPHMYSQQSGHIINMASMASLIAIPTYSIYAASKFGIRGFTQALTREVEGTGVRVSGIYPGAVDTEFTTHIVDRPDTGINTPKWIRLSSQDVATAVWKVVQQPRRLVVIPRIMWPAIWLNLLAPGVVDFGVKMVFKKISRADQNSKKSGGSP